MSRNSPAIPRFVLISPDAIFGLSLILGLVWWASLALRGALNRSPRQVMPFLIGCLAVQVAACILVLALLRSAHRSQSGYVASGVPLVSLLLLFGSGLFYFTPVVGTPILLIVILVSGILLVMEPRGKVV